MRRRNEVLVGILLTVAVIIGVLGTIWLVRGGFSSGYPLYARFAWGAGVKQGQPVRLAGVQVGYVAAAELDPRGTIVITMSVKDNFQVPDNSTAAVQPVGFFGDMEIALTPARPSASYFAPGDTVPAALPKPGVEVLTARADTISRRLDDVARTVQLEMVSNGGIADLRRTLASTNELVRTLSNVASEQSRQLTLTLASLRRSASAIDSAQLDSTVRNLRATTANTAALTGELRKTTEQLNGVIARLQDTTGTAGKLLNDPAVYNDLHRLVSRLDSLTADFKRNPRRYINLEIF